MRNGPPRFPSTGRRRRSHPESVDCSIVFLERATGCRDRFPVGPDRAPNLDPRAVWPDHGFTAPSAASRTGSRTGLPHCTPLRHCGVDEARDWPRLPESVRIAGIAGRLSPLLLGALPRAAARAHTQALIESSPIPSLHATQANLGPSRKLASAGFASGYVNCTCTECGFQTAVRQAVPASVPAMSTCGRENFVEHPACPQ